METRAPTLGKLAVVAGFMLSCFGLLLFLWVTFGGPTPLAPQGYRFEVVLGDATQLVDQTDVRVAGVSVGKVVGATQEGGLTRAEVELDPDNAPIPADTRTLLRRKTLLGETFIQLFPGTPEDEGGTMLEEGGTIELAASSPSIDLDEVLRAFDPKTRDATKIVLRELAAGVGKRGPDLNASLAYLRPLTKEGADVFALLASQRRAVRGLVRDSGEVLDALAERRGALRSLVTEGDRVLSTTAARDAALTETVELLPEFLDQLRPTLARAQDVGERAEPLLTELGPASRHLTPTVRELNTLAPDLRGLFTDLGPVLDRSDAGLPALTSVLGAARPLMRELRPALQDAVPAVDWLIPYKRELPAWLTKLGLATQSSAGAGDKHMLRTVIPFGVEGLAIHDQRLGTNRHNPYSKPGYLDDVGTTGLRAFDCDNVHPGVEPAPPCVEQGPFDFGGLSLSFPQVKSAP